MMMTTAQPPFPALRRLSAAALLSLSLLVVPSSVHADLRLDGGDAGWDTGAWRTQVDGVMGGQSSGSLSFLQSNEIMSFTGDIVLDGGGFSSVRKSFDAVDLTPYAGIVVQLETTSAFDVDDIQPPLGLHLQFHDTVSRYIGYASAFAIPVTSTVGQEVSVFLPLNSFDRGSRSGWQCSDCRIDFSSVNEMDIYVLFQSGPFDVRVKKIYAVDADQSFPSPSISLSSPNQINNLIDSTIRSGGGVYDKGYQELCIAMYRSVLNTILAVEDGGANGVVSNAVRSMICQGFQRAATQIGSKADTAWTLRHTLDAVVEELGFAEPNQGASWRPDPTMNEYKCSGVTSETTSLSIGTSSPDMSVNPDETAGAYDESETSSFANAEYSTDQMASSSEYSLTRSYAGIVSAVSILMLV